MGSGTSEEDEVSELDVEIDVEPSINEITITRAGALPITARADSASPADNEPSTLEPHLSVRGLVAPSSGASPPPATFAEVGGRAGSEAEDDEERTTQNIESNLHAVYERALAASTSSSSGPLTQLSPIIMTPSEPIRLESSRTALEGAGQPRRPAPIPAAGRPPDPEWERESEVTARPGASLAEAARSSAASGDAYDEDETSTNAMHSDLVAASRARAETVPLPTTDDEPDTRTVKAPLTMASEQALFVDSPGRKQAGVDDAHANLDAQAGAGATVRMFFNAATGQATAHPESDRSPLPAQSPMQAFGEQPTVQALPLQRHPAMGAPPIAWDPSPASLETTLGRRRKPRRVGRLVVVFVLACAASGVGVLYRDRLSPWIMAHAPAGWREPAPVASVVPSATSAPEPATSAPAASASSAASAAPATSASPRVAASATASAFASASASPGASASASAQRNGKKRFPPRR